ncbi:hypothetical protein FO519_000470 [Halicephalobus sp. NKZ332]|nr:hypothetical protein FO519_000470 [Halicephalobus sp. NKZ332]
MASSNGGRPPPSGFYTDRLPPPTPSTSRKMTEFNDPVFEPMWRIILDTTDDSDYNNLNLPEDILDKLLEFRLEYECRMNRALEDPSAYSFPLEGHVTIDEMKARLQMRSQFAPGVRPGDTEHAPPRGYINQLPFSPRSQQQVESVPGHVNRYPFSPGSQQQQQFEPGPSRGHVNRFPFSPGSHQQPEPAQQQNYVNRHSFSPDSQQQQYPMQMNQQMRQTEFFSPSMPSGNFRMTYNPHQPVNQRPVNHMTQPGPAPTRSPPFPHGPAGNHDYPTLAAALQKPQQSNQQLMQQFNHGMSQGIPPGSVEDRRMSVNSPASQASVESGSGKRKRTSEDDSKESGAVKKPKNNIHGNFYRTTVDFLRSQLKQQDSQAIRIFDFLLHETNLGEKMSKRVVDFKDNEPRTVIVLRPRVFCDRYKKISGYPEQEKSSHAPTYQKLENELNKASGSIRIGNLVAFQSVGPREFQLLPELQETTMLRLNQSCLMLSDGDVKEVSVSATNGFRPQATQLPRIVQQIPSQNYISNVRVPDQIASK